MHNGKAVGEFTGRTMGDSVTAHIQLSEIHLWQPLAAKLYDLEIEIKTVSSCDTVKGYFGIRELQIDGGCVLINGKRVFQRLVLDQGFYPDGIYTAPNDEALRRDIELSVALGFNGARLHERFLNGVIFTMRIKWAILFGANTATGILIIQKRRRSKYICLNGWKVLSVTNSPSVIGWCPLTKRGIVTVINRTTRY